MRITVTQVSAALAGLGLALAGGLYWSLHRVDEPYRLTEQYYALQSQISIQTRQAISAYLETGDAMRLLEAEHKVRGAIDNLNRLPPDVARAVAPELNQLLDNLTGDFTAAGKLAGDPQGLLMNAEREIGDGLALVVDYARDGYAHNAHAAFDYSARAQKLNAELRQLSHARQRYFGSRNPGYKKSLDERIARMQGLIEDIATLPKLGLMTTPDPDALVAAEPEDRIVGIVADLRSLLRRYPDELGRTHDLLSRGTASKEKVQELVAGLDQELAKGETEVRNTQSRITQSITVGGIAFVLCLLLSAAVLPTFRRPA